MAGLAEIRERYPVYGDWSDEDLSGALYERFYADKMDRAEFDAQLGLTPSNEPTALFERPPGQSPEQQATFAASQIRVEQRQLLRDSRRDDLGEKPISLSKRLLDKLGNMFIDDAAVDETSFQIRRVMSDARDAGMRIGEDEALRRVVPEPAPRPLAASRGLEPFDPEKHKPRDIGKGGPSTELTLTEDAPGGGVWNIPSIWWDRDGNPAEVSRQDAHRLAVEYEEKTGERFPRFENSDAGVSAARERSASGGASKGRLAGPAPEFSFVHVTAADARADEDAHDRVGVAGGAEPFFAQRTEVAVVADGHGHVESTL